MLEEPTFPTPCGRGKSPHGDISPTFVRGRMSRRMVVEDGNRKPTSTLEPFAPFVPSSSRRRRRLKDFGADRASRAIGHHRHVGQPHNRPPLLARNTHAPQQLPQRHLRAAAPPTMGRTAFVTLAGSKCLYARAQGPQWLNAMKQVLRPSEGSLIMFPPTPTSGDERHF